MDRPLQEGDILAGKYRIERVLAQGGMGVVVAAIHQQLEQRVALKFLLPEGAENAAVMSRFLREAKAAVRLRSEHVARVLDVGTAENGPYIVMEYLEGRDLSGVLDESGRLDPTTAVTYVMQAIQAIAEAHALGIIHRDLKPANLFLTKRPDGSPCVKVLDFGISKVMSDLSTTKTTVVMGTPYYMAPEQLQSSKNVDVRSDIWSLGMILYELVTGEVAFRRDTLPELCTAILFDPLPPLRERVPELDAALAEVVERALEKRPRDRQQTLAELASDLAPFLPEGDAIARRIQRVLESAPAQAPLQAPTQERAARVPDVQRTTPANELRQEVEETVRFSDEFAAEEPAVDRPAVTRPLRTLRGWPFAAASAALLSVATWVWWRGRGNTDHVEPAVVTSAPASLAVPAPEPVVVPSAAAVEPAPEIKPPAPPSAPTGRSPTRPTTPRRAPVAPRPPPPVDDDPIGPRK